MTIPTTGLRWLETPAAAAGSQCGVPFPRESAVQADDLEALRLRGSDGRQHPIDIWPAAFWPEGTVKWAGLAVAGHPEAAASYSLENAGPDAEMPSRLTRVDVSADTISVRTPELGLVVARSGEHVIRSIERAGRIVAANGRLISSTVDTPDERSGVVNRTHYASRVTEAVVESSGRVRTVVRVDGVHTGAGRDWLPFRLRFYVSAGSDSIRLMHSFVWDGDENRDFLASLGVQFEVPMRDELHDRHVRIAGADDGFLVEAVRGVTGLRRDPGAEVRNAQVAGRATPPLEDWSPHVSQRLDLVPSWPDYRLSQTTSDGFSLRKRTSPERPWIGITTGTRAGGFAYVGGVSGGLGAGLRDFWQSYPVGIDIADATTDAARLTLWLYSPEAAPMDLRFYHDGLGQEDYARQLEGLEITYEDYEPGFGTPYGIARTHELTLFPYAATPGIDELVVDARASRRPAMLQVETSAVRRAGLFGDWGLIDRTSPERAELEDKLEFLFDFYREQVEQRRWYGFWNYGDVMHTYDADRHVWRYDVGGYAWDNSELSPDLWLWYSYLRSGRADVFRFAEAMTRHTGEVDVYHAGAWAGLGSRHNVQHWGCSAKQHRISNPAYRRFFYYLTADERTGDLLTELVDSDRTLLGLDPTRKVRADVYTPDPRALAVGLGTDWGALAATWLTAWERTGDERARDRLLGTMRDIGRLPHGFLTGEARYDIETGRFDVTSERLSVSHLSAVFGLTEIASELIALVDDPGFERAWLQYCRLFLASPDEQEGEVGTALRGIHLTQAHSRLTAYAAARLGDPELAARAWTEFAAGGELLGNDVAFTAHRVLPPVVLEPVTEARTVSTNDASQFGLAAIQLLALVGESIPVRDGVQTI